MKIIPSRLPDVGTSIFTVMSRMALEYDAINLSQGFPDFKVSETLIELIHKNMVDGHNQYAPMPGVPSLRNRIAAVVEETYGRKTNPETEITVTAGGTEALFAVIAAVINPGDEALVFDPAYDSYDPAIRLNGGIPVHISLHPPLFAIPWDEVASRVTPRTRLILINTPHNPTGKTFSDDDLKQLEAIALKHDLVVLSDEVYERIIFDDVRHCSVLQYPDLAARSAVVFSFGKTFHATGWKVGYVVAPESLTKEIRKTHQFITFSVNTPVQLALAEYLADPGNYLYLAKFYQQKRDFFLEQIRNSAFSPLPCGGSYFQLLSYERVSGKPDIEMANTLTRQYKLASIPVSVFYQNHTDHSVLRFCFAKNENTLARAGKILSAIPVDPDR
jgi:methionine aminotransferase